MGVFKNMDIRMQDEELTEAEAYQAEMTARGLPVHGPTVREFTFKDRYGESCQAEAGVMWLCGQPRVYGEPHCIEHNDGRRDPE